LSCRQSLILGYLPSLLRAILCGMVKRRPDPNNWSEYPNVWGEAQDLIFECPWYKVYDVIAALHAHFVECDQDRRSTVAAHFAEATNQFFVEEGIGWQLLNGEIVTRGSEAFETAVTTAAAELNRGGRPTGATHIHEARTGAVTAPHARSFRRCLPRYGFIGVCGSRCFRRRKSDVGRDPEISSRLGAEASRRRPGQDLGICL